MTTSRLFRLAAHSGFCMVMHRITRRSSSSISSEHRYRSCTPWSTFDTRRIECVNLCIDRAHILDGLRLERVPSLADGSVRLSRRCHSLRAILHYRRPDSRSAYRSHRLCCHCDHVRFTISLARTWHMRDLRQPSSFSFSVMLSKSKVRNHCHYRCASPI